MIVFLITTLDFISLSALAFDPAVMAFARIRQVSGIQQAFA